MAGINANIGITVTAGDSRYYPRSEFIAATAGATDAGKPIKTDAGGLIDSSFLPPTTTSAVNNFSAGRLCLATGNPNTINQTGSATLYWTPYNGNTISLIIGGVITEKTFTEQSIDFSAKTDAKLYDIFAYWDTGTGTVKIEELVWTDDTTRATALALSNGVYYKSGDTTRKYLGTVYTYDDAGTTKIRDEESNRYVDNFFNKIDKNLKIVEGTGGVWTYSTSAWREWNGGTNITRANFVCGLPIVLNLKGKVDVQVSTTSLESGIGVDTVSAATISAIFQRVEAVFDPLYFYNNISIAPGKHYFTGVEYAVGTTSSVRGLAYTVVKT